MDIKFYLKELQSEECQCGKPKNKGFSFCYGCYKSLPIEMQRALWQQIGAGYEDAYDQALKYLGD